VSSLLACVQGIGVLGPGLAGWEAARAVLALEQPYVFSPTVVPPPQRLPAAERRRAGTAIKIALAVAEEACANGGIDPTELASVFASSSGDGANCHVLCESLAAPERLVSPTRFTNSVHNAAAGYWHIAVGNQAASTSVCAFDASFGAGLLEALTQLHTLGKPLLLVASEVPYPEPLHATRPLPGSFAVALVLSPEPRQDAQASLTLELAGEEAGSPTSCGDPGLEDLRRHVPAARSLPLLQALAAGRGGSVLLDYQAGLRLHVRLQML
jgi:hypothetical protein